MDIRLKMHRAGYLEVQELARVYENLLPEYKLFVRRHNFRTLWELTALTIIYEVTRKRERERSQWNSYQEQRQLPTPRPRGQDTPANVWNSPNGAQPTSRNNDAQVGQGISLEKPAINVLAETAESRGISPESALVSGYFSAGVVGSEECARWTVARPSRRETDGRPP